jgi:hypothetical protein
MNARWPDQSLRRVEGVGSLTLVHGAAPTGIGQVVLERSYEPGMTERNSRARPKASGDAASA